MAYSLKIGSTTKTLDGWGIDTAVLTQISRAAETLEITSVIEFGDVDSPIMSAGDTVELYENATKKWAGECLVVQPGWVGSDTTVQYSVRGQWFFLDRAVYRQKVLDSAADPIAPVDPVEWTANVILFQDESAGRSTSKEQLSAILEQTSRLEIGDVSTMADLDPLGEDARSITLLEAISRCLNWHPRAVTRVNPDNTLDVLETLSSYNLPLEDVADSITITPRPDLRLDGAVLTYRNVYQASSSDPSTVIDSAGDTSGENVAFLEYDLGGASVAPTGIAAHWLAQFSGTQYEVSFTLMGEAAIGTHLGTAVNITGSSWGSIAAPVQRATYDLLNLTTQVQAGPLSTASIDDMIELLRLRKYTQRGDGARLGQDNFIPEEPGTPFSSYRPTIDTFKLSPGFVGGIALSNTDDDYDGDGVCWLEVSVDANGSATAVTADSGVSVPASTSTTAIIPLHDFETTDGEISVNDGRTGNMSFLSIGTASGHYWESNV